MRNRISLGQRVALLCASPRIRPPQPGVFIVVQHLHTETLDGLYRIRHEVDGHERVATEEELQPVRDGSASLLLRDGLDGRAERGST